MECLDSVSLKADIFEVQKACGSLLIYYHHQVISSLHSSKTLSFLSITFSKVESKNFTVTFINTKYGRGN